MLANIEDGFKDNDSADSYSTLNGNTNFAIVFMDYDGNIIEIESYDQSDPLSNLGAEYPKRIIIGVQNKHQPIFTFLSTKDKNGINMGNGIYFTQVENQEALFTVGNTLVGCSGITAN